MGYAVDITERAGRDLALLFEVMHAQDSEAAARWYRGLAAGILSLSEHPKRCPAAPEDRGLRHLLYGRKPNVYRVIFRVVEASRRVEVLHIRHGARRRFRGGAAGVILR